MKVVISAMVRPDGYAWNPKGEAEVSVQAEADSIIKGLSFAQLCASLVDRAIEDYERECAEEEAKEETEKEKTEGENDND